jgi:cytochrome c oxidase cbb3-type subunit 3
MNPDPKEHAEDPIREHVFDGIQEYDKKLPNWWLMTLYGAIVFAAGYWFYYHYPETHESSQQRLDRTMNAIALAAAKTGGAELTDEQLWAMSKDSKVTGAGAMTFQSTCATCHMPDLTGKIGVNLRDNIWIHGGKPTEIITTITNGVAAKGMPTWGPVLGKAKIAEVAAFILSYHSPSDPIVPAPTASTAAASASATPAHP